MNNMKMKQNELLSEMKQALDLVSNLSNFILEEKDVSNNAKIIIKKIGDIHSVLSGSTFTAKSFFDSAFEFATSCKDKAIQMIAYCESLKQENEQLFIRCQKPKCFNQGTNTEDCFVQDLQLKEDHAAREAELLAVAARLKADRRQLKDRVVDQFAVIETLKRQVETDKIVIAGLERQVSEALLEERRSSEEEDGAVSGDEEDEVLSTGRTASGRDHRRHDKNTYFEHSGHSGSRQSASKSDDMKGTDYLARRHHKSSDRSSEPHRLEDNPGGLVNSLGIHTSGSSRARRYDHHNDHEYDHYSDHEYDHEYDHNNDKTDHMDSENISARRSEITNSKPPRPTKPPVSAEEHRAQLRGASNEHRGTPSTGSNQDSHRMNHQSHTNAREKSERHVQEERSDDRKSSGLLSSVAQLSLHPDTNPTRHQHSQQNSNQQNQQNRHVSYHRLPEGGGVRSAVLPPRQREEHDGGEEVWEETEEREQSGEAEGDELMSSSWETVRDCDQSPETSSAAVDTSADMLFSLVNQYYNHASPTNG